MNDLYSSSVLLALAEALNNLEKAANGDAVALKEGLWYFFASQGMVSQYAFLNFDRASAIAIFQQMKSLSSSLRVSEEQFLAAC